MYHGLETPGQTTFSGNGRGRREVVPGYPYANRRAALSPDGRTLAVAHLDTDHPVTLFDVAAGMPFHELDLKMTSVHHAFDRAVRVSIGGLGGRRRLPGFLSSGNGLCFSPDGRHHVTWSEDPFASSPSDHVAVWDVATGRAVTMLPSDRPVGAGRAAFAPDGRTLATASKDGTIRLWQTATWQVRAEHRGHRDRVTALAFAPDGRLYTGGLDTSVLVWDPRPPREAKGTLADAWAALAGADAKAAHRGQGRLLADPAAATAWIAAHVPPATAPDPARVQALIADLDRDDFTTRERAAAALRDLDPLAAAALRDAVANPPSPESRRQAEALLRDLDRGVIPAGELRALRSVEMLEWQATPEARARLEALAKGAPDARLTRAANAALHRLR